VEDTLATPKNVTTYTVHKLTYSDGRAYRYHVSDDADNVRYVAERTGMQLPSPTRLVEFFDPEHNPSGRLQPPATVPWLRGTRYEIFVGEETEEPYAVIQERWGLVDILLLRLPHYEIEFGKHRYIVRGSRYGARLYGIFRPPEKEEEETDAGKEELEIKAAEPTEEAEEYPTDNETGEDGAGDEEKKFKGVKVGEIRRPAAGPSYIIEVEAAPLRQALLVLAALAILIDMEQFS
jgi:hypothetical protein